MKKTLRIPSDPQWVTSQQESTTQKRRWSSCRRPAPVIPAGTERPSHLVGIRCSTILFSTLFSRLYTVHHCPCSILYTVHHCHPLSIVLGNHWKPLNKDSVQRTYENPTTKPLAQQPKGNLMQHLRHSVKSISGLIWSEKSLPLYQSIIIHHMNYISCKINCNYINYIKLHKLYMSFTSSIYLTKHFPSFFTQPVRAFPKRSTPSGSRFANQRSSWILSTSNETVGETASCWSSVSLSFGFWLVHIALSDISWLASEISSSELIKKCKIWVCLKMLFTPTPNGWWSLSLKNGYFIGNIFYFQTYPFIVVLRPVSDDPPPRVSVHLCGSRNPGTSTPGGEPCFIPSTVPTGPDIDMGLSENVGYIPNEIAT